MAAIERAEGRPFEEFRRLFARDARSSFTTTDAPAILLRGNLEPKYRIARSRGKTIEGDTDLLTALTELGNEPVSGFVVDGGGEHVVLYVRASDLEPVGCVMVTTARD